MEFQSNIGQINWKVHFSSPIDKVFKTLSTDEGRGKFWAESTIEGDGVIEFNIIGYPKYKAKIIDVREPYMFCLNYFGTEVTFILAETEDGGTDLALLAKVDSESQKQEMIAGWVSVLMAMKGAVDFGVDLRNHNPKRSWDKGYLDN